jgi:hypothetical protein
MRYSAYLRGGQLLSVFDEEEAVWQHLTARQRDMLLRTFEADINYQCKVAQYPRSAVIEVPLAALPFCT